jgi:cation:H+ antiporter
MLLAVVFLIVGLVLLVFSADYLVKGAASLAASIGISPLVVGLTVVAFGTSAPELAVSVMSAFKGQADLALGNVIGSNIFNILVILGISAMIIPLTVHAQLVRFDVPVMIFLSLLLFPLAMDGVLSRRDGVILVALLLGYVFVLIRGSRREKDAGVLGEFGEEYGKPSEDPKWLKNIAFVLFGVAGLVVGSDRLVFGAVFIAKHFGVSELIIGLTIISAGTSLPEVATSVVAALPVFFHGYRIGRASGFFFLAFYVAYIVYLILDAKGHSVFPAYRVVMLQYVAPAAALALAVLLVRAFRQRKNPA